MEIETNDEQQTTDTASSASREDLIAAVREAGGAASVDVEAEARAAAAAAPAATDTPTTTTPAAEEEPRIQRLLREREKATAEREAAKSAVDEMRAQAQAEADRIIQEARERADREWRAEMDRRRQHFEASPTEALRALGDPQQIVDQVLKDGTPEGRALREIRTELAQTKEQIKAGEEAKAELAKFRSELQKQREAEAIANVRSVFLGHFASKELTPHLHARYDENEIFGAADALARTWQQKGLAMGDKNAGADFDFEDVAQYLELEAKKRLTASGLTLAQQVSASAPPREPGIAPKASANGSRTLSAATGSERRTSPKPLHDMTPDEQRQALIDDVAAARRQNPDAKM